MNKRSPVHGYNHNFKHRGLIFHVQTEDSGVDNPHLFTHLFHGGGILSSQKTDYDPVESVETVKALMQKQHKVVLKGLKDGDFDDKIDDYLGHKEDLLPRKTAPSQERPVTSEETVARQPARADTEHDISATSSEGAHEGTEPSKARTEPSQPPEEAPETLPEQAPETLLEEAPETLPEQAPETHPEQACRGTSRTRARTATVDPQPIPKEPVSPKPATQDIAHSAAISLDSPSIGEIPEPRIDNAATEPVLAPPTHIGERPSSRVPARPPSHASASKKSQPAENLYRRPRNPIPTPISMPAVGPSDLGDPVVTFNSSKAAPSAPKATPRGSQSKASATYSMRPSGSIESVSAPSTPRSRRAQAQPLRAEPPRRPAPSRRAEQPPRVPSAAPPKTRISAKQPPPPTPPMRPKAPAAARGKNTGSVRARGKAANSQPGQRRSSVVVSRPSIIVGASAKSVGSKKPRRGSSRAAPRPKSTSPTQAGRAGASDKSLDEVIMAYLSEDSKDK